MKLLHGLTIGTFVVSIPAIGMTLVALYCFLADKYVDLNGFVAGIYTFLFVVGVPLELFAIAVTIYCFLKKRLITRSLKLMAAGHMLCLVGFVALLVYVQLGTSGWELLALPFVFAPGQVLAGIGLFRARSSTTANVAR